MVKVVVVVLSFDYTIPHICDGCKCQWLWVKGHGGVLH